MTNTQCDVVILDRVIDVDVVVEKDRNRDRYPDRVSHFIILYVRNGETAKIGSNGLCLVVVVVAGGGGLRRVYFVEEEGVLCCLFSLSGRFDIQGGCYYQY